MRKPVFCMCENIGTDQLRGHQAADHHLCFGYIDSTITLLPKTKISSLYINVAIFCGCTARFALDLMGNPKDRFSHDAAQKCISFYCHRKSQQVGAFSLHLLLSSIFISFRHAC